MFLLQPGSCVWLAASRDLGVMHSTSQLQGLKFGTIVFPSPPKIFYLERTRPQTFVSFCTPLCDGRFAAPCHLKVVALCKWLAVVLCTWLVNRPSSLKHPRNPTMGLSSKRAVCYCAASGAGMTMVNACSNTSLEVWPSADTIPYSRPYV